MVALIRTHLSLQGIELVSLGQTDQVPRVLHLEIRVVMMLHLIGVLLPIRALLRPRKSSNWEYHTDQNVSAGSLVNQRLVPWFPCDVISGIVE